jgi:Bifunctional DNA primase/polymerase, N-terminal
MSSTINSPLTESQPVYIQNALQLAALGVPVELFQANTKACKVPEWHINCTTDADEIIHRSQLRPGHTNIALVAQAKPGGCCFLDDDNGLRKLFEAAGHVMQKTRKHESCSGNQHYIYKHSAKSLQVWKEIGEPAYIQEANKNNEEGELWSLRMDSAYIVGPSSTALNHSGEISEYKTVGNFPIIEIPDDLLDFLVERYETEKKAEKGKTTDPSSQEPRVLVKHGKIHEWSIARAGKLRGEGLEVDEIESILLREVHECCEAPINEDKIRQDARSMAKYKRGTGNTLILVDGQIPVSTPAVVTNVDPKQDAEKLRLDELTAQCDEVAAEILAKMGPYPEFPLWAIKQTSLYEGFVKPYCDVNSRYESYMWLPAAIMLMNFLGTKIRIEGKDISLSIFAVLIGQKGRILKSSSVRDALNYMKVAGVADQAGTLTRNAEGKSLVWEAGSLEGLGLEIQRTNCKNFLLYYDELEILCKKAAIESSTLLTGLLKVYESVDFQNTIKSRKESYSIPGGTYCASLISCTTDRMFKKLWSRMTGANTGLNDRFFFLYQPEYLKPIQTHIVVDTAAGALKTRKLIDKALAQGSYKIDDPSPLQARLNDPVNPWNNRQEIRAEKIALYMAIDLGHDSITDEDVERAIAIVDYEQAVKRRIRPSDADNVLAAAQIRIYDYLYDNGGQAVKRDMESDLNARQLGTKLWDEAFGGLIKNRTIIPFGSGRKGDPIVLRLARLYKNEE